MTAAGARHDGGAWRGKAARLGRGEGGGGGAAWWDTADHGPGQNGPAMAALSGGRHRHLAFCGIYSFVHRPAACTRTKPTTAETMDNTALPCPAAGECERGEVTETLVLCNLCKVAKAPGDFYAQSLARSFYWQAPGPCNRAPPRQPPSAQRMPPALGSRCRTHAGASAAPAEGHRSRDGPTQRAALQPASEWRRRDGGGS